MLDDLLSAFNADEIESAMASHATEIEVRGQVRALLRKHTIDARCASSDAAMATCLHSTIPDGHSLHVLSTGDVDALSYIKGLLALHQYADELHISTWRINTTDLQHLDDLLNQGRIGDFHLLIDPRFERIAPDQYSRALELIGRYPGSTMRLAPNHSKVTLFCNREQDVWIAIESSANVNTNKRMEQTSLHRSRQLWTFYADMFASFKNADIPPSHAS